MHRIFISDQPLQGRVVITGEKAGYLALVLRSKPGDTLIVHDHTGEVFLTEILTATRREVVATVREQLTPVPESPVHLRLLQGILKGEKMDLVIQKTVELGVSEIVPVVTERSQVRETRRLPRWQKISEEAARQCGRAVIPAVREVTSLSDLLDHAAQPGPRGIIFWEAGGEPLRQVFEGLQATRHLDLLTGPEGGFSEDEVRQAGSSGFITATLGRRILRAETAAIAAVSLCQFALGDLGAS